MTDTPPYLQPFVLTAEQGEQDEHPSMERVGELDFYRPTGDGPAPAILFVHGGPGPDDLDVLPRDWPVYQGYGAAAAALGVAGVTVEHRLIRGLDQLAQAADDVEAAVDRLRADPRVDPERIALWFFSGAGLLMGEWLDSRPDWLRCVAATYPRLSAPADAVRLTSAIEVVGKGTELPVMLTRVGLERDDLAEAVTDFVAAAESSGTALHIIDVPNGRHGFDMLDHTDESRDAVVQALEWTVGQLTGDRADIQPMAAHPQPQPEPEPVHVDPVEVVASQLAAYNAHDLPAFLATYAPNAMVYPRDGSAMSGRRALREHYEPQFDAGSGRAEIVARIAEGEWVVDHEIAHGVASEPTRLIVMYRVHGGLIVEVRFLV